MDADRQALKSYDPEIFAEIAGEEGRQTDGVEMIPSENYTYPEVLAALGSVLTNKYSEGYPGRRYYGGQEHTDAVERLARERACALFGAEHANVQPLSGSPMNQAAYFAVMQPGDTVLAMDLSHGGHLTHGAPVSHMGKVFNFVRYKTGEGGAIDFEQMMTIAKQVRPKIVLAGYSSYPRDYDYAGFRQVADEVGALAMADISHIGGLVAAGVMANPFDAGFDIVTTTTHKSLRGPRGGMILCRKGLAKAIDSSVFPGLQGGPHMNNVAGAAITFKKAAEPAFRGYAEQVLANAKTLARTLLDGGARLITGGTDNHMMVIDTVESFGLDGRAAEEALDRIGVATNKQVIPDDPRPPLRPSGVRLGTPACTTRGMGEEEMRRLGGWMVEALRAPEDAALAGRLCGQVRELCRGFAVPGVAKG
ncbi:serine hydroxymethyltransferase [Phenylobacterium sp.]|uniref:serine hydroxymethyltransferase n=1 Tax=Phenylobacterium sp. TaxID=1871053 RepID=UPI0035ADF9A4